MFTTNNTLYFRYWMWKLLAVFSWAFTFYMIYMMSGQLQVANDEYFKAQENCAQYQTGRLLVIPDPSNPTMSFSFTCEISEPEKE